MDDFIEKRNLITINYLQNLILRLDFDDIVSFESITEKKISQLLSTEGYSKHKAFLNDFNMKLNTEEVTLGSSPECILDQSQKIFFVFINEEKKIKIEVSPLFIVINKYGNFEGAYEKFEYFSDLLAKLYDILCEYEIIAEKRLGIRKINAYKSENIENFFLWFKDYVISDLKSNDNYKELIQYAKLYSYNNLLEDINAEISTNYQVKVNRGVNITNSGAKELYQCLIDIDSYTECNKDIKNSFETLLNKINSYMFNLYMNSYSENTMGKNILKNQKLY